MIIPIEFELPSTSNTKLPPSVAKISHDEVVLIELQGTIEVESTYEGEHDGKFVGKLNIDEALKRPTLRIGHHHLEGTIVTLPKPLAVIHKTRSRTRPLMLADENDESGITMDQHGDDGDDIELDAETIWQAVAIVKRKIMFSKRPMPIVGKQN